MGQAQVDIGEERIKLRKEILETCEESIKMGELKQAGKAKE